jgi:hypothetical protein
MEASSNLLRLKLDMVYRDLPIEEVQKRFAEVTQAPDTKPLEAITTVEGPKKPKRKVVKALVPKK